MTARSYRASCSCCTRDPVGVLAAGAGLRARDDVLAAAARLARGRRVAAAARAAAGRAAHGRGAGLVHGGDRQFPCPGGEGRPKTGPSPVDRARTGSKHHVITEAHGIPLAVSLTGGHRNDVTQLMPLIAAIPPVRGRRGRPRRRPEAVYADRGYDHDKYRKQVRKKDITPGDRPPPARPFHTQQPRQTHPLAPRGGRASPGRAARPRCPRRTASPRISGLLRTACRTRRGRTRRGRSRYGSRRRGCRGRGGRCLERGPARTVAPS